MELFLGPRAEFSPLCWLFRIFQRIITTSRRLVLVALLRVIRILCLQERLTLAALIVTQRRQFRDNKEVLLVEAGRPMPRRRRPLHRALMEATHMLLVEARVEPRRTIITPLRERLMMKAEGERTTTFRRRSL